MVALALYGLAMRIDDVSDLFRQLARRVFRGRSRFGLGFAAAAHSLIASYRNGRFPAEDIDAPLSELFGDGTMLDHAYLSSIGTRLGFPVVDVDSSRAPSTCIVTSYNGAGDERSWEDPGGQATYRVLRAEDPDGSIYARDA